MPYQQKSNYISLITTIIIFGIYYFFIFQFYHEGRFEGAGANALIGKSILWLIAGGVIINIVAHILFAIIFAMITNEAEPDYLVDERDKLFELKALRVAYYIIGFGFIASMVALAMGQSVFITINILLLFTAIAGIVESFMQIYFYRRGF